MGFLYCKNFKKDNYHNLIKKSKLETQLKLIINKKKLKKQVYYIFKIKNEE